jgi:hypothetical protein
MPPPPGYPVLPLLGRFPRFFAYSEASQALYTVHTVEILPNLQTQHLSKGLTVLYDWVLVKKLAPCVNIPYCRYYQDHHNDCKDFYILSAVAVLFFYSF